MPSASLKLEISSDLNQAVRVREFVRKVATKHMNPALNDESVTELVFAVHEATINIMNHSYNGRTDQPILVEAHPSDVRLTIHLNHWGKSFDPSSLPTPVSDGARGGGFGLLIIKNSVDEVTYDQNQSGKHTISLAKNYSALKGDENMDFNVENIGDIVLVTLPGNTLEASNAQEFSNAIAPLLEGNKKVVFDLSLLNFIDSTGCKAILLCYKKVKNNAGLLHLCSASDVVSALFRLMNLHKLLGIYGNREEAVKAFEKTEEML